MVFGVADNDDIIGLTDIKSASEFVSQKIKERIEPLPEIFMELHKLDGDKDILTVKVMEGEETPYYYKL